MLFTPIGTAGGIYASLAERTPDTTQAADKIEAVFDYSGLAIKVSPNSS